MINRSNEIKQDKSINQLKVLKIDMNHQLKSILIISLLIISAILIGCGKKDNQTDNVNSGKKAMANLVEDDNNAPGISYSKQLHQKTCLFFR